MKYLIQELVCHGLLFAFIALLIVGWYMSISHVVGLMP